MWLPLRSASLLFLLPLAVGLSPGPARAAAPCNAAPVLTKNIGTQGAGADISEPVDVNGTLFFAANDGSHGKELWKSDGTLAGTVLVQDIRGGPASSNPTELTVMGSTLFFLAEGGQGVGLWKSNGMPGGTEELQSFPGMTASSGAKPATVGNTLYFVAAQALNDFELWKSNGTSAGTVLVRDIYPGPTGSFPSMLTAVGDQLFFQAGEPGGVSTLWKSDATGTVRMKDVVPGAEINSPQNLTAVGQLLFFTASSSAGHRTLWKSDGTAQGTVLVRDFEDMPGVTPQSLTAAGNTLFFQLDSPDHGLELWKSDGTTAGTGLVKDIQPGKTGSSLREFTSVGSTLFFVANDGVHGEELWKSDGTSAGTRLVRDIVLGSSNPIFGTLSAGPGVLLMEVDDLQSGGEPWRSDGTAEGTYRLADLAQNANKSTPRAFSYSGNHLFFAATQSASIGEELFVVSLRQVDCTEPTLTCPPVEVEALSSRGVQLDYPPVAATDDAVFGLAVYFDPPPGMLPLGTTRVRAAARDLAGNPDTCSFDISVVDKTRPVLLCPERVEQEATGPNGARPHFFVVASDAVTEASQLSVEYQPRLDNDFPIATTNVTVTAMDQARNRQTCTVEVAIRDTTPPQLRCPPDWFQVATSEESLNVDYPLEVLDAATPNPQLTINHPPRSRFPLGETVVDVQARDGAGNTAQCSFKVQLVDPQGPAISCPETQYAQSSGGQDVVVNFSEAVATDNLGQVIVSYSHAPGSAFPEGETEVTATASDLGGQTATCTFKVVVERGSGVPSTTSCQAGPWSGGLGWLLLVLIPAWARRRAGRGER